MSVFKHRKVAATSALALAATGFAFAGPASAATSETLNYTCATALGEKTFTVVHEVPDTVQYGGTVDVTSTVTVPEDVAGALYAFLGVRKVEGTLVNAASALGVNMDVTQDIPSTDVPASGPMTVVAEGGVNLAPFGLAPDTAIPVAVRDAKNGENEAPDAVVSLDYTYADGTTSEQPSVINCELAEGQTLSVGTVTVVQAETTTKASLAYAKKAKKLTAKAVVKAPESGVSPSDDGDGKVKFTVKKGKKTVGTKTVALNDAGVAKASWKNIGKGTYKLVAKYLGTDNFEGSTGKASKTV